MFGLNSFTSTIEDLLKKDFIFTNFFSNLDRSSICLRHDIDFSVIDAYKVALIEKDMGIRANYFFMLSSNTYNPISSENRSYIEKISKLGHKISLHFDPSIYDDIDTFFIKEKEFFENIFGVTINIVSLHRPRKFLEDNNRKLKGCNHTYEDKFFKNMKYLSDSAGRDIRSDLKYMIPSNQDKPLHLLIHPIWWTTKSSEPSHTLNNWLEKQNDFLISETARNCRTYQK
tara:strand:- start:646 stop:1332 length:687 start_codon:yes stop_codon:yes gene_type:complete